MTAFDVPTAMLALGILALCVTTAITALGIPVVDRPRRRRRRPSVGRATAPDVPVVSRRVVTGRPPSIDDPAEPRPAAAIPLPAAGRAQPTAPTTTDGGRVAFAPDHLPTSADEAEAFIGQLVDEDPQRMADLMMKWMNSGRDGTTADATSERPATETTADRDGADRP